MGDRIEIKSPRGEQANVFGNFGIRLGLQESQTCEQLAWGNLLKTVMVKVLKKNIDLLLKPSIQQ